MPKHVFLPLIIIKFKPQHMTHSLKNCRQKTKVRTIGTAVVRLHNHCLVSEPQLVYRCLFIYISQTLIWSWTGFLNRSTFSIYSQPDKERRLSCTTSALPTQESGQRKPTECEFHKYLELTGKNFSVETARNLDHWDKRIKFIFFKLFGL